MVVARFMVWGLFSVTPYTTARKHAIPRVNVTSEKIAAIGHINISYFRMPLVKCKTRYHGRTCFTMLEHVLP